MGKRPRMAMKWTTAEGARLTRIDPRHVAMAHNRARLSLANAWYQRRSVIAGFCVDHDLP
jgi:hypothetical protein